MSYSRDFDRVTVEEDQTTVRVEATSLDENGKPGSDDPATAIHITLIGLPSGDRVLAAKADQIPVGATWTATFPDAVPALAGAQEVLCVGVAFCPDDPPYVWYEQRAVSSRTRP